MHLLFSLDSSYFLPYSPHVFCVFHCKVREHPIRGYFITQRISRRREEVSLYVRQVVVRSCGARKLESDVTSPHLFLHRSSFVYYYRCILSLFSFEQKIGHASQFLMSSLRRKWSSFSKIQTMLHTWLFFLLLARRDANTYFLITFVFWAHY